MTRPQPLPLPLPVAPQEACRFYGVANPHGMTAPNAALAAFRTLAAGIAPDSQDLNMILRLIADLRATLAMHGLSGLHSLSLSLDESDGIPAVHLSPTGKPKIILATAWIETLEAGSAFFYWES